MIGPPSPELRELWLELIRRGQPYRDVVPYYTEPSVSILDSMEARHVVAHCVMDRVQCPAAHRPSNTRKVAP